LVTHVDVLNDVSSNTDVGPPHESDWTISDVQVDSTTQQCLGDWVCEHRWPVIKAMVEFRSVAEGTALRHWWSDGQRQIAFARAGRAFIAINHDASKTMNVNLYTSLPAGVYCDVTSGQLTPDLSGCTGRSVTGQQYSCPSEVLVFQISESCEYQSIWLPGVCCLTLMNIHIMILVHRNDGGATWGMMGAWPSNVSHSHFQMFDVASFQFSYSKFRVVFDFSYRT